MFAVLVINTQAPLAGTFHYHIPHDLADKIQLGHLVEVEFGRQLAQGIVIGFDEEAPVEETKPIINIIEDEPVVFAHHIQLAQWLSQTYLAPLNACLRLMLPPGLTRWSDITVDINPNWDGRARLTELQEQIINHLRQKGDRRGRQLGRAFPKTEWKTAVNQLVNRDILRKASVLDPPRIRPKKIRTAALIASDKRIWETAVQLGRQNKQADVLLYLLESDDPLPSETAVLAATNATEKHTKALAAANLVRRDPLDHSQFTIHNSQFIISLAIPQNEALSHIFRLRSAEKYLAVLTLLRDEARPVAVSDIYAATGASITHLRKLVKLDLIRLGAEEVWRDPLADRDFVPADAPRLTKDQSRAWGRVKVAMLESGAHPLSPPHPL
ncbi:MAG: hypothetical protein ACE5EY_15420, partial [Anaerolineae bacterium]